MCQKTYHGAEEEVPTDEEEDTNSLEEVKKAVDHMKNNKSPGHDGLPAEVFIIGAACMKQADDCGEAIICPVFKNKRDRAECGNYRGISLLPHVTKIYERILERRLRCLVEDRLEEWQYGFRSKC